MSSYSKRYEVHFSATVAEQFRRVHRRAALAGFDDRVLAAYNFVVSRLETDPQGFGEPLYQLPNMRLQLRCAAVAPLVIHYAVALDRCVVYVKGIDLLSE